MLALQRPDDHRRYWMRRVTLVIKAALIIVLLALLPSFRWEQALTQGAGSADSKAGSIAEAVGPTLAYVANEGSGTISVIDVATSTITKTICLGSDPAISGTPQPSGPCNVEADHHKPFYNGHLGPHGLWLTPNGSVLLVTNRISGTVVAIDTA